MTDRTKHELWYQEPDGAVVLAYRGDNEFALADAWRGNEDKPYLYLEYRGWVLDEGGLKATPEVTTKFTFKDGRWTGYEHE